MCILVFISLKTLVILEKNFALCETKKNILTLLLSEKKILNETKNHNPPLQVKWSVPYVIKLVSNLQQVGGFLRAPRFPPPIKLTATI